ncbi:hypothetical protein Pst134EB_008605 [Puccinia striiformis f. sp. tritici]|nr:hypothetical protein Pst134EB_008605 [Puccinia striiformis f. sp. tritici]
MSHIADWESDYDNELEHQHLGAIGNQVMYGLEMLARKLNNCSIWRHDRVAVEKLSMADSIDRASYGETTLDRLQPGLTLLRGHFTTLARSLDPINLNEGAESALKRALQNQQEFDGAVVHINSRFVAAVPEPAPAAMQYGDQHLGKLKSYRLRALKSNFAEALDRMGTFLRFAKAILRSIQRGRTIHNCQLLETTDGVPIDHWLAFKQVIGSIDSINETMRVSDWDLARQGWPFEFKCIDTVLLKVVDSIAPEDRILESSEMDRLLPEDDRVPHGRLHWNSAKALSTLMIPVIKLSRLYFNKISVRGISSRSLPLSIGMCSQQIATLAHSLGLVSDDLQGILCLVYAIDLIHTPSTLTQLIEIAERLHNRFEAPSSIFLAHMVPSIPDTEGFPTRNYYESWIVSFNTQRTIAIDNLIDCARTLRREGRYSRRYR